MKTIVVSAVNINIGGTVTILKDCLEYLSNLNDKNEYRIIAIVHKKSVAYFPNIEYIEIPWAKKMWVYRLWCEYVYLYFVSKKIKDIYLWLSLHDTTPTVIAKHRVAYCHNSFPFYDCKVTDLFLNYKIFLFAKLSKYIYLVNQKKNDYIVVQQEWFRKEFVRIFRLAPTKIIVAPPKSAPAIKVEDLSLKNDIYEFIYPASSNSHKNFDCLCEATKILESKLGKGRFRVNLTIDGSENDYSKWVKKKWANVDSLKFIGYLDRKKLYEYYQKCNCLIFPSKVETWGLPITEFAAFEKPMLLADMLYAHETAVNSSHTAFFNPNKPGELAMYMERLLLNDTSFLSFIPPVNIEKPVANNWDELFKILLNL